MPLTWSLLLLYAGWLSGVNAGALTLPTNNNNNSQLWVNLNATNLDVALHIAVLEPETNVLSPPSLEAIIRAEVDGDWQRATLLLQLVNQSRALPVKRAIYRALWQELQHSSQIHQLDQLLDFHELLQQYNDVPAELLAEIYQAGVASSARLMAAPFHTASRSASFPIISRLLQRLTFSGLDMLRDIFEALYELVLALESPLSVAERLGNFSASVAQLTLANLQLLARRELRLEAAAQEVLQRNLRELLQHSDFEQLERQLREQLLAELPPNEQLLFTAQKICLRNASDASAAAYVYECPQTYLICSNVAEPKKAAYQVQRGHDANGTLRFAFHSAYWRNRYLRLEPSSTSSNATHGIVKNVYSRDAIGWWLVRQVAEGVALYDAATAGWLLCGGDPQHWDGEERHVYTRNAADFELHRRECVWRLEDCSDAA